MPAPTIALPRTRFESLGRGVWLMHATSEAQVEKLSMPLTIETARRGDDLPMLSEMLKRLEGTPEAPAHIVAQLQAYKAQLLCMLTGDPSNQTQWRKLIDEFTDCFHPIN